jgi:hypothetical protein
MPNVSPQELQGMVPLRGLSTDEMWLWFRMADPQGTGAVSADNAVGFLKRSGLSTKTLAWVCAGLTPPLPTSHLHPSDARPTVHASVHIRAFPKPKWRVCWSRVDHTAWWSKHTP